MMATTMDIQNAAAAVRNGQLVAFGTETVYGLGGDATNAHAVATIFAVKSRPSFNPLISHVPDAEAAFSLGITTPLAQRLADLFWPGPMTLVLDKAGDCPVADLATAGLDTIALRVPAKPEARAFLAACAVPVAAPSANRSGRISPTTAGHVSDELGDAFGDASGDVSGDISGDTSGLAMILDFGPSEDGLESTVIDARGLAPIILRPGSITAERLVDAGFTPQLRVHESITSPGQMQSHYAPEKPVVLNITTPQSGDIHIGFGANDGTLNLDPGAGLVRAAANLYGMLRMADSMAGNRITIAPIPNEGLGRAINDRLSRAASSR